MADLVLTLLGPDRPGLVEAVADTIAQHGGNWLESRMAHLAGKFAGILRLEITAERAASLQAALGKLEGQGLRIVVDVDATAKPEHAHGVHEGLQKIVELEVVGLDRPGIVREVSALISQHGGNVEELHTELSSAPMSGEMLFRAEARVNFGFAGLELQALRAGLERLAGDLMVEMRLVEARRPSRRR